ncbi:MAG: hypothetical protein Q7U08_08725 [Flavobacteriaceae bacterium]|nr:hypothetical protein [Flavobacteriaceae bacterium]
MIKIEVFKGFLVAIIATVFSFYIYIEHFSIYSLEETIQIVKTGQLFGKLLTLSALPNVIVFFIFIKKNQDYRARGVLLALFTIALLVGFLQLI